MNYTTMYNEKKKEKRNFDSDIKHKKKNVLRSED